MNMTPAATAQLERVRGLVHDLACGSQLSVRATQRELERVYGIRRSIGSIQADLSRFSCSRCQE